jgi:HSP20 family protein
MAQNKASGNFEFAGKSHAEKKGALSAEGSWVPNTDVLIAEGCCVVRVELAGMRREDLELNVQGNQLRIGGKRSDLGLGGKRRFLVMEINYGSFESVIDIPPGYDLKEAHATFQNGFLRIDVPEAAPAAKAGKPAGGGN